MKVVSGENGRVEQKAVNEVSAEQSLVESRLLEGSWSERVG